MTDGRDPTAASCGAGIAGSAGGCTCGGTCGPPPAAAPDPSASKSAGTGCGDDCTGDCTACRERSRVNGLNWAMAQADSHPSLDRFWRRATIGDSFHRATGEIVPEPVGDVFAALGPHWTVEGMNRTGREPDERSPTAFPKFPEVMPWTVAWSSPAALRPFFNAVYEGDSPEPPMEEPAPFSGECALISDDTYPDHTAGDDPECTSIYANTFYLTKTKCAIGRILVKCQNDHCDGHCEVKADGSGCECIKNDDPEPPPPPLAQDTFKYSCCCCPKGPIEVKDRKQAEEAGYRAGGTMFGHVFTLRITLDQKGRRGFTSSTNCKCSLRWTEWTTRGYGSRKGSGGPKVPPYQWFDLSSDDRSSPHFNVLAKEWSLDYGGSGINPYCARRTIELTDTPSLHVKTPPGTERELWISVCVARCADADPGCHEDDAVRCIRIYQRLWVDANSGWHGHIEFVYPPDRPTRNPTDVRDSPGHLWSVPEGHLFAITGKVCPE